MEIHLTVPQILQNPELPNGCEITSCCELLRFFGFRADKCDLADHYLLNENGVHYVHGGNHMQIPWDKIFQVI